MAKKATQKVTNNVGTIFSTESAVRALAEKSKGSELELTNKDAALVIEMFKDVISDAVATGQKVQLTGFLTLEPSYRKAREGNNVATNEKMEIPESVVLNAKAGKKLKDVVKALPADVFAAIKAQAENKGAAPASKAGAKKGKK